jgi:hypothetical protein
MTFSNVTLESLSRDDVHTKLTCQANNFENNVLRTSVELDMKCENQVFFKTQNPIPWRESISRPVALISSATGGDITTRPRRRQGKREHQVFQ